MFASLPQISGNCQIQHPGYFPPPPPPPSLEPSSPLVIRHPVVKGVVFVQSCFDGIMENSQMGHQGVCPSLQCPFGREAQWWLPLHEKSVTLKLVFESLQKKQWHMMGSKLAQKSVYKMNGLKDNCLANSHSLKCLLEEDDP